MESETGRRFSPSPGTHTLNTLLMKYHKVEPPGDIEIPESVNREADRIEENVDAMLRLVDYIWFLKDDPIPS